MEFINQYFMETIAVIVILTIIIIIAILKRPQLNQAPKKEKSSLHVEQEEKIIVDKFEEEDEDIEEDIPEARPEVDSSKKRTKRELVPHEKIVKDDFETFKGTRILVAEDNMINQKVITALLASSGIDVTIANDGQECINILKEDTNFSLILMDAHMPIVDGFQATRHIRSTPQYEHIPVIALSGDTAADDIRNMLNVGMEDHLEKPLKLDSLYDILYIYTTGDEANQSVAQASEPEQEDIEFDINQGLEICGGDKEFYLEILNEFMTNYSDSATKIQTYLNANNSRDADKLLLDITGLAANIGADYLHKAALELKQAIASPDDMAYIDSLKTFKRTLNHITKLIEEYIQTN